MSEHALPAAAASAPTSRLLSLDVLRGLVILAMIFVNDVAGVPGVPAWMKHRETHFDGMTFVDLVFPAFLFMVGMALPFAIGRRLEKGDSPAAVWKHVLTRTAGLVAIGFLMFNGESLAAPGGVLSVPVWNLLMYAGIILLWNDYAGATRLSPRTARVLRAAGLALLAAAVLTFHGETGSGPLAMRHGYWGIIGLIGWAYLAACVVYVPFRRRPEAVLAGQALLLLAFVAEPAGLYRPVFGDGQVAFYFASHAAIVLAGVGLGMMLQPGSSCRTPGARIRWAALYAVGLYAASVLVHALKPLHEMFIVSKNLATPAWALRSAAWTVVLWIATYALVDLRKWRPGTAFLSRAGANALFAYILAPIVLALFDLAGPLFGRADLYGALGSTFAAGFARAVLSALLLTGAAGSLQRWGVRPKL